MARVTAAEFAEKWARRTKGATADYTRGIERVTEAPGAKAAAKADKMLAGVQESISSGKWQERVAAVPLSEWKAKATQKGAPRIAAGVDGAQGDMAKFGGELLAAVDSAVAEVETLSDATLEDRITRATTYMRRMSEFRRSP